MYRLTPHHPQYPPTFKFQMGTRVNSSSKPSQKKEKKENKTKMQRSELRESQSDTDMWLRARRALKCTVFPSHRTESTLPKLEVKVVAVDDLTTTPALEADSGNRTVSWRGRCARNATGCGLCLFYLFKKGGIKSYRHLEMQNVRGKWERIVALCGGFSRGDFIVGYHFTITIILGIVFNQTNDCAIHCDV